MTRYSSSSLPENDGQDQFAKAFHTGPDAMVITDRDTGRFREINTSFTERFGWSREEAIGRTSLQLGIWRNQDDRQRMLDTIAATQRIDGFEVTLLTRSGDERSAHVYGCQIELRGQVCLVLTIRDITRLRAQEQALRDSQERLDLALDSAQLGIWDWHIPSGMLFGSIRAAVLHELPARDFHGPFGEFFACVDEADRRRMRQAYARLTKGPENDYQFTYRAQLGSGEVRYLESRARLYRDTDGQPLRMAGTLLDITEQVLRERSLEASEEKFASLFQGSPDPICVSRVRDGEFIEVNPSFCSTFGWQAEEVIGRSSHQLTFWADHGLRERLFEQLMRDHSLQNVEVQFLTRDEQTITCTVASRLIWVDRQLCILSTFRDVTRRLQSEADLKASQEKFYKAFHSSPDAITITERDSGRYIEVNEGFHRLTGYRPEEVIGQTSVSINIWADPEERLNMIAALKRDGFVHHLEMRGRHRDGTIKTVDVSVEQIELGGLDCLLLTARDTSELRAAEARIQHLAYHDALTDLPNRALLMDRLKQQIALLQRHNLRGALMFLDLDHFKHINDSLGHSVGDAILQMVTARLEASVRQEDTVARLGGDEFVVLLTGIDGSRMETARQVRQLAEKLRDLLAEPMLLDGHRLQITPSIGIALIPDDGATPEDLLKRADIAMYRAKDAGRNTVQLFHASMQKAASERLRLESGLRMAIARREFSLHYQPQIDSRGSRIIGAEALLRWEHPTQGPQSPASFIRVLEDSGLIIEVGHWVIEEACRTCARLLAEGRIAVDEFSLSVNISPRQFRQNDFVERVLESLHKAGLPASLLKLEITEGIVIQQLDDTIARMLRLRQAGVHFAMDDFGTGYSSLTYLKRLPVDSLKIDQSFVRDAPNDSNDAEIVRAIIAMGHSLGLELIAEGVETPEQLALLEEQGCHTYQGYLFSRPVPFDDFVALLPDGKTKRAP
ncbi:EAL domain-containing protein [Pseudomonas sp. ZM23]|uniref:EAL domain-containing protein n=1 Tax=Pseudomonas triclosanedens TaxID=2961893 RepID=A0ABY6ZTH1_9PSED|nr:EAL domain-containing protein [Pseudomonas triclosanedens]MCP8466593.1 EAL domain-containing protein [Pseudomonas triclosanedens]MCP8472052.1 EAL domain-containing protein [Pseudomonas triclosanedens]MCP8474564.1 EAL domain-containing protein [Pseudomonas triclosanedens]WAI48058.1 EAL domain-containing protein [Pseudomonas triclosanedens]